MTPWEHFKKSALDDEYAKHLVRNHNIYQEFYGRMELVQYHWCALRDWGYGGRKGVKEFELCITLKNMKDSHGRKFNSCFFWETDPYCPEFYIEFKNLAVDI